MFVTLIIPDVDSTFAVAVFTRFSAFLKSCRSSKRCHQHIVATDGFTLTASFSPIFAFTTTFQLIIFHGHCRGNVQFKLLIAVVIIEITVIRTEESSGRPSATATVKTAETIQKEQKRY
jgi:hypothetical protein